MRMHRAKKKNKLPNNSKSNNRNITHLLNPKRVKV